MSRINLKKLEEYIALILKILLKTQNLITGGFFVREGMIPTVLGTAVTGVALAMRAPDLMKRGIRKKEVGTMVATGLIGFGLAHVVLGSIDLFQGK